jgi:hypothetical protein
VCISAVVTRAYTSLVTQLITSELNSHSQDIIHLAVDSIDVIEPELPSTPFGISGRFDKYRPITVASAS